MSKLSRISEKKPEVKSQNSKSQNAKTNNPTSIDSPVDNILFLQRTIGNQVVQKLIKSGGRPDGGGQPLHESVRHFYEPSLGQDFKGVRVHTDSKAIESAREVNAQAFTIGQDIVFGAGQYAPLTRAGNKLLAHELVHVVQQMNTKPAIQGKIGIGEPSDNFEKEADTVANTLMENKNRSYKSVGLQIRHRLRNSQLSKPTIQRKVTTWAGEWDTDKYNTVNTGGVSDGVDIELRFKPGNPVDAKMIGMVQIANTTDLGKVIAINPTVAGRSIPAGKAGAGFHIDQLAQYRNPLYATGATSPKDTMTTTPTNKAWGQHGYHYIDKAGTLHKRDAILKDTPQQPGRGINASQIFETTALAVTGVQTGTYYGSVQWGWRTDAAGKFSKLTLTKKSDDVPSSIFARAARKWGTTATSTGDTAFKLRTAIGKYTNVTDVLLVSDPANPAATTIDKLAKNARVEVTDKGAGKAFNKVDPKIQWWKVTAVEGTYVGKVGWVMANTLSDKKA